MFYVALSPNNNLLDLSPTEITPWAPEVQVQCLPGDIPDLSQNYWNPSILAFQAKGGITITRLEFLRRLTAEERISARARATTDPVVADLFQLIDLAENIRLDDPDTKQAIRYLALQGIIAPERVLQIVPE